MMVTLAEIPFDSLNAVVQPRKIPDVYYREIGKVHNSVVGHLGVDRTLDKLIRLKVTWPEMKADIYKPSSKSAHVVRK
jgi:hypothetical protein